MHLFADDVQLYFECVDNTAYEIGVNINQELKRIFEWSIQNMLSLNISKTHALFITKNPNHARLKPVLLMDNSAVDFVDEAISLGITVTNRLDWDRCILIQCGKIYGCLRSLYLTCSYLSITTKLKLFKSLILPYFVSIDFLLVEASSFALSKVRVALNACVRFVFSLNRLSRVSHLQHQLLGCPLQNFAKMRCCQLIHSITKNCEPSYLLNKLHPLRSTRTKKFLIPRHRTAKYGNSFFVRGVGYWNLLPNEFCLEQNTQAFRRKCTEHFN